jgi:hypothetical protein
VRVDRNDVTYVILFESRWIGVDDVRQPYVIAGPGKVNRQAIRDFLQCIFVRDLGVDFR